jgi:dolichol kinase
MTPVGTDAGTTVMDGVDYRNELLRKAIHLCSLSIPIAYAYLPRDIMLQLLLPLTALFVAGDLLRSVHPFFFKLYTNMFGAMLRRHEKSMQKKTLNGASWVLLSAVFCVLVFPRLITITAFAILIVSDTMAALIGRRFGTRRYRDKSLEGSLAFVLSAVVVILFTPKAAGLWMEYVLAAVAAVAGAGAEVLSFDIIDDNFAIPVAIGGALWLLYLVLLPGVNVHILDLP